MTDFNVDELEHQFCAQELLGSYPHLLSSWEKNFCVKIRSQNWLSEKQGALLARMRDRCQREAVR